MVTLRPGRFTPGNRDPVPIVQDSGWAPGQERTGAGNVPTVIRSPDCPARRESLYRLSYPGPLNYGGWTFEFWRVSHIKCENCVNQRG